MDKRIIIGATAAAVAIIMGVAAFTQWTRIKTAASVAKSAAMNEAQVTEKSDENAQITQDIQAEYQLPDIQLTPEMREAIANGEMTFEEAAAQLLSGGTQAEAAESGGASEAEAETPPVTETEAAPIEEAPAPIAEPQPTAEAPQPAQTVTETPKPSEPSEEEETASLSGVTEADAEAEARRAEEVRQAEEARRAAEAKQAEEARKAAEAQKAEEARKAEEAKKAEEAQTAADAKKAEEERKAAEAKKAEEEKTAKTQNLLAQLYVLRDSFNARIDGIINECIEEFLALEPSKQTKVAKLRIVYARMDTVEAMESECDAQVEAIAAQLDEIDPALGEKARQYYKNEKELKKASLISQYGG